jgi:plasmid replication initiation protein
VRARLAPADVEAIAERVLDLLERRADRLPVRYVDAATLAAALGVDRAWVYAHARALGAIRLGGSRGRLRLDVRIVERALLGDTAAPTAVSNSETDPRQR